MVNYLRLEVGSFTTAERVESSHYFMREKLTDSLGTAKAEPLLTMILVSTFQCNCNGAHVCNVVAPCTPSSAQMLVHQAKPACQVLEALYHRCSSWQLMLTCYR